MSASKNNQKTDNAVSASISGTCIYLDCNATTPIDPSVATIMLPLIEGAYGNPHSEHALGWEAAETVDRSREHVAKLIGAEKDAVVFTSGATEANNHAIQGILRTTRNRKSHVVTTSIEHKCVLQTLEMNRNDKVEVDIAPVGPNGRIETDAVASLIQSDTVLVSIGMANNEIGTIQPIAEIGALCRERGIAFHTDAAQAVGKIPIDVEADNIDLLSLSGHKIYGPKGIGALYVSRHSPIKPEPLILGGAQQNSMRAGTVPTFLCAGLGEACKIAGQSMREDASHSEELRTHLLEMLRQSSPDLVINGSMEHRLPGNLNIQFPGVDAEALLSSLQGRIAASTGSACNAGMIEPSYVLRAIGLDADSIASSIRIGIGRFTTREEIEMSAVLIGEKATRLRGISSAIQ